MKTAGAPPSDRRSRRKHQLRERILDAAIECFVANGFEATTMDAIADRADVARATVFNHFSEKQQLLSAYLARRRAQLVALLRREAREDRDPPKRLYDALDLLARINEDNHAEARELVQAWWRTGGSTATEPDTGLLLAEVVAAGQRSGQFRADLDPSLVGALLLDAYVGLLLRWVSTPDQPPFSLRDTLHQVCGIVLDGLRA
jgi:TetR/AcrR family transcriptional regulator, cholesterol catabolism regulator